MKKLLVIVVGLVAAGCASTVPMTVKSVPSGRTREQMQLDNLECSNLSQTHGPWVYGIGTAIMRSESAKKYAECMSARGYVVERSSGDAGNPGSPGQHSPAAEVKPAAGSQPLPAAAAIPVAHTVSVARAPAATKGAPAGTPASPPTAAGSAADRLKKLEDLYKSGLITKDEYDRKRQDILSEL